MNLQEIKFRLARILEEKLDRSVLAESMSGYDTGDIAEAVTRQGVTVARLIHRKTLHLQVQVALNRIGEGTYGTCLNCDEPIDEKRINAVPWSPFCVVCQDKLDRGRLEGFEQFVPAPVRPQSAYM